MPDPRALFEILIREHSPMLSAYLRAVCDEPALVDDLFQETCLTAWRRLDSFDRSRPFAPWLRGIARHLVLASYRRQGRVARPVDGTLLEALERRMVPIEARPGDTFDDKLAGLRQCVEALEPQSARVIHLHYWQRLQVKELAGVVGVSLEAAKKRLQRARASILACMRRKYPLRGGSPA